MSCFGCSRKYGLFCKEYGCPNCGYSYCAKCLKRPIAVPRRNNEILNVCLICYDKLSKIQTSAAIIDVGTLVPTARKPDTTVKQNVDEILGATALGNVELPKALTEIISPKLSNTHKEQNADINVNLDHVISKRLKDLKTVENTSDHELRERLSNLSGVPQKDYSKKDILLSVNERTDQEKINDLLEQFVVEADLDKHQETERNSAISDIEKRLKALRGDTNAETKKQTIENDFNTPSDNEQDDETMLKDIMVKYLEEGRLPLAPNDDETVVLAASASPARSKQEQLPWCCVCNEDASLCCKGCDDELFCAECFRDFHDSEEEYRLHEKVPYSAKPKFKEDHF